MGRGALRRFKEEGNGYDDLIRREGFLNPEFATTDLEDGEAKEYLSVAALLNCQGLYNVAYATKRVLRMTSRSSIDDLTRLKRMCRYLSGKRRAVCEFQFQEDWDTRGIGRLRSFDAGRTL